MVEVAVYAAPRRADAPEELEDAHWPPEGDPDATLPLRAAVADGATVSSFSGLWARLLVRAWGEGTLTPDCWEAALAALAARWQSEVGQIALPWFAAEKARGGAHAAFIGLDVQPCGEWSAAALGDCCLFLVRDEALLTAFPALHPDEFEGNPVLLGTGAPEIPPLLCSGQWRTGDRIYLMSDALARWFLESAVMQGRAPWRWLHRLARQAPAQALVALARQLEDEGRLRPDDITLVVVSL